jgi:hypothetical protein
MRAARLIVFAAIGGAALLLPGACRLQAAGYDDGVSAVQFKDVVVPAGLSLRDTAHESHSIEEAGWRLGRFVYQGTTPIEDAVSYVRQRMPQHSWAIVGEQELDQAGRRLRFERGVYSASYTFERREGVTQMIVDYATDYTRR